jgi:hypothetical protein
VADIDPWWNYVVGPGGLAVVFILADMHYNLAPKSPFVLYFKFHAIQLSIKLLLACPSNIRQNNKIES